MILFLCTVKKPQSYRNFRQKICIQSLRVKKLSAFLIHYYMNRTDKSEEMDNFISGITRSLIGDRTTVTILMV